MNATKCFLICMCGLRSMYAIYERSLLLSRDDLYEHQQVQQYRTCVALVTHTALKRSDYTRPKFDRRSNETLLLENTVRTYRDLDDQKRKNNNLRYTLEFYYDSVSKYCYISLDNITKRYYSTHALRVSSIISIWINVSPTHSYILAMISHLFIELYFFLWSSTTWTIWFFRSSLTALFSHVW